MGPIYRGFDFHSGEPVVIKRFEIRVGPERTRQLADDLAALALRLPDTTHHARVFAGGLDAGQLTLVMAQVPGEGLDAALAEYGPAAIADALPRLDALASVLDDAAAQGIWHGTLNPRDIIVSATSTSLTGLGLAQILEAARVPIDPRPPYTAPEASRDGDRGPQSDQFALAAIAHEWLLGARIDGPAETPVVVPALAGVDGDRLADAFSTALAPDPSARFASCGAFVAALREAAQPSLVIHEPAPSADLAIRQLRFDDVVENAAADAAARPVAGAATRVAAAVDDSAITEVDAPRRWPLATFAAVFVAGLVIGSAGGYWVAARRDPAPTSTTPAGATAPAAPAPVERREIVEEPIRPAPEPLAGPASLAPPAAGAVSADSSSGGPARLLVRSTPAGATVIVDGAERGTTPLALRDLPVGTRAIRLEHEGYEPAERRVVLSAERPSRSIDVALARRQPAPIAADPAAAGSLVIESRPPGAQVTIDGQVAGVTPLTVARIAPGRHTVLIAAPGWAPVTTTVDVKPGARARVAATLEGRRDE